jgi:hypothetical protein
VADWKGYEPGTVRDLGAEPPSSSLVDAFKKKEEGPADAIVLRGYLGRSDFFKRTRAYIERAEMAVAAEAAAKIAESTPATVHLLSAIIEKAAETGDWKSEEVQSALKSFTECASVGADASPKKEDTQRALSAWFDGDPGTPPKVGEETVSAVQVLGYLKDQLKAVEERALPHVPLRLFLTPSLDRYVDFHSSSVLAVRREPRPERTDTFTVWLRVFQQGTQVPIPYRVIHETVLGPSFAAYLGGDLIDEYLGQPDTVTTAWGDQSSLFGGGRPGTGKQCGLFGGGRPGTGKQCGEW